MHKLLVSFSDGQMSGLRYHSELSNQSLSELVRMSVDRFLSNPNTVNTCSGSVTVSGYLWMPEYKRC